MTIFSNVNLVKSSHIIISRKRQTYRKVRTQNHGPKGCILWQPDRLVSRGKSIMPNQVDVVVEKLDEEWVTLMQTARELGLTIEEIRLFLDSQQNCVHE